jgi:hypothetical protein
LGGPALKINPTLLPREIETGDYIEAITKHIPNATFTSRGCIRRCPFCAVPIIEGNFTELQNWIPRPIVCDNNLLACSKRHFTKVIDSLRSLEGVDFNQGLDARLLSTFHIDQLKILKTKLIRFSWDDTKDESSIRYAIERMIRAGYPKRKISIYVLIGFNDSPTDALYRLSELVKMGVIPFPMRFQELNANIRNSFVGVNWTHLELVRFMRYWSNLRITKNIPFEEFIYPMRTK